MRPLMILGLSAALVACAALCPPAWAGPNEGGEDEVTAKIKEQMAKILRLMEENEEALLEVSTGGRGEPKPVEVAVPPGEAGTSNSEGNQSERDAGTAAAKKLEEIIKAQRGAGMKIPGELAELVRLVPQ